MERRDTKVPHASLDYYAPLQEIILDARRGVKSKPRGENDAYLSLEEGLRVSDVQGLDEAIRSRENAARS